MEAAAPPGAETGAMDRALDLAARGVRGANPLVGSVVLSPDGRVLGTGYHRGAGTAHAEVAALTDARSRGADPAGGTLIVTLEPCNHSGRTGPCSAAILAAGIRRVVFAAPDRTAQAAGGADWLTAHGVECSGGLRAAESELLNERWMRATAEARPFVTLKTASSLDGCVAAADGTSQWITGAAARQDGHAIRARADAVLAGTGTVLADDPRLTARPAPPERIAGAGTPDADAGAGASESTDAGTPDASLTSAAGKTAGDRFPAPPQARPLRAVMGLREVPEDAAVRGPGFVPLRTRDVQAALSELYARGVRHVLVEGGPGIAGAFVSAGVVDELVSYVAPLLLGEGTPMLPPVGVRTLAAAHRWTPDAAGGGAVTQLGSDIRVRLRPAVSAATGQGANAPADTPSDIHDPTDTHNPADGGVPDAAGIQPA